MSLDLFAANNSAVFEEDVQRLYRGMPVGVAYGIWSATGVALTAVLAKILFDEPFTWLMGLGVVAIAGGVLLIEIGAS